MGSDPEDEYSADCHIDDDKQFTYGEYVPGVLVGDLKRIKKDCKLLAQGAWGGNGTQGLKNIRRVKKFFPGSMSAVCHIDDDTSFTAGEFVLGRIEGVDIVDVRRQCEELARFTFGSSSSACFSASSCHIRKTYLYQGNHQVKLVV